MVIDFCSGAHNHRRKHGGGYGQALAKACGVKASNKPAIIDATAGLGSDSFVLATLGCKVQMIERNSDIATALSAALETALADSEVAPIVGRMSLHEGDANLLIPELGPVDVIYLDPMFPHRTKSALVKKPLRDLRKIVGDDFDNETLLNVALKHAKRVVVKRPKGAPDLSDRKPSYVLKGKSNRFDVYQKN